MSNATVERPALTAKRTKWVKENARTAESLCLCGCGDMTKSRFVPGHDAKLRRMLDEVEAAGGPTARVAREAKRRFGWA